MAASWLTGLLDGEAREVGSRPSLCENVQEPTTRRIIFSIALFPIAASVLFLFRLTKSRRTFYAQIERLCFHTGSTQSGLSVESTATAFTTMAVESGLIDLNQSTKAVDIFVD